MLAALKPLRRLLREETAATSMEYALLITLTTIIIVAAAGFVGARASDLTDSLTRSLAPAQPHLLHMPSGELARFVDS